MRPVHQPTLVIPFIQTPNANPASHAKRHPLRQIDIMCHQDGLAVSYIEHESLVAGLIVIVRQQAPDEARCLDPGF